MTEKRRNIYSDVTYDRVRITWWHNSLYINFPWMNKQVREAKDISRQARSTCRAKKNKNTASFCPMTVQPLPRIPFASNRNLLRIQQVCEKKMETDPCKCWWWSEGRRGGGSEGNRIPRNGRSLNKLRELVRKLLVDTTNLGTILHSNTSESSSNNLRGVEQIDKQQ